MRTLAAVAVLLAIIALAFLWLRHGKAVAPLEKSTTSAADPAPTHPEPKQEPLAVADRTHESARTVEAPAKPLPPANASTGPRSHVFGRVVDEGGAPLPGTKVTLRAYRGHWSEASPLPEIEFRGRKHEGLQVTTGNDGKFELDVPLPTADHVSLDVEPSLYYLLEQRTFGMPEGGNRPPLVAGDNDQGDFVLAYAGAVMGRVLREDASMIEGASAHAENLGLDHGFTTKSPVATSDVTGTYLLGHLPAGSWKLSVERTGFVTNDDVAILVRRGGTSLVPDVRLARSPEISGIVVDEAGKPVPLVTVWGWPTKSSQGVMAKTRENGTFTLQLPANEPFSLEIEDTSGFEQWMKGKMRNDASRTFEPGRADVRIVLQHAAK